MNTKVENKNSVRENCILPIWQRLLYIFFSLLFLFIFIFTKENFAFNLYFWSFWFFSPVLSLIIYWKKDDSFTKYCESGHYFDFILPITILIKKGTQMGLYLFVSLFCLGAGNSIALWFLVRKNKYEALIVDKRICILYWWLQVIYLIFYGVLLCVVLNIFDRTILEIDSNYYKILSLILGNFISFLFLILLIQQKIEKPEGKNENFIFPLWLRYLLFQYLFFLFNYGMIFILR